MFREEDLSAYRMNVVAQGVREYYDGIIVCMEELEVQTLDLYAMRIWILLQDKDFQLLLVF